MTEARKNLTRPRIELRTFRVLGGRDNQLHHRVRDIERSIRNGSRHGAVVSTSRLHREGRRFEPGCRYLFGLNAPVAQWIRRRPSKPEVVGSIPTRGVFLEKMEVRGIDPLASRMRSERSTI